MTAKNNDDTLVSLKERFLRIANEQGVEIAERQLFAGLDPLAPATVALHRTLLGDLKTDERGRFFYEPR
jgi:hypothetical protein